MRTLIEIDSACTQAFWAWAATYAKQEVEAIVYTVNRWMVEDGGADWVCGFSHQVTARGVHVYFYCDHALSEDRLEELTDYGIDKFFFYFIKQAKA